MRPRAGLVKILAAAALFLLWWRGYLSAIIAGAGTALMTPPPKAPFGPPGSGLPSLSGGGQAASGVGALGSSSTSSTGTRTTHPNPIVGVGAMGSR